MNPLNEPLELNNGIILSNRLVMAPMTTKGSSWDGIVEAEDFEFYARRSEVAGLIITGATAVSQLGENFSYQMSVYDDRFIPGLSRLAQLIQSNGSKAVMQIYHSGVNSRTSYQKYGIVVGASAVDFHHLSHVVSELKEEEILSIIEDFGQATRRAIQAGFDGVEIHGAYGHLIQQFFSKYSNRRSDYWGGSLRNRMNFALAIVNQVKLVAKQYATRPFIIGFRLTEEEFHQDFIGYDIEESLQLIDLLADKGLDYIHGTSMRYAKPIHTIIHGRTAFIAVAHAYTADEALKGLDVGNLVSIARAALVEPDFAKKIKEGRADEIQIAVTSTEMAKSLLIPQKLTEWMLDPYGLSLVPKGMNHFIPLVSEAYSKFSTQYK